jgi:alpha-D-ribose 1-methylphosphonate 5-phosphate C-P lyase
MTIWLTGEKKGFQFVKPPKDNQLLNAGSRKATRATTIKTPSMFDEERGGKKVTLAIAGRKNMQEKDTLKSTTTNEATKVQSIHHLPNRAEMQKTIFVFVYVQLCAEDVPER